MGKLVIDRDLLANNIVQLKKISSNTNCEILGVVKSIEFIDELVSYIYKKGIKELGSTRPLTSKVGRQTLISLPSIKEVEYVVRNFKASYNSSIETISKISDFAATIGFTHKIILSIDIGDLREGIRPEDAFEFLSKIRSLKSKSIKITGIATNYACCSGLLPTIDNLRRFSNLVSQLEKDFSFKFDLVSVGGSAVLPYLSSRHFPKKINQIRIGEAMFLGEIPGFGYKHQNLNDTVHFKGEIVEIQTKAYPNEKFGLDAFGEKVKVIYNTKRKRAILNFGLVHTVISSLTPIDDKLKLISINSNYSVYDVTDSDQQYQLGDIIHFKVNYASFVLAATSNYVKKEVL